MSLEAFRKQNKESAMPLRLSDAGNEDGGLFKSVRSVKKNRDPDSMVNMTQLNSNMTAGVMRSIIRENASTSRYSTGHKAAIDLSDSSIPTRTYLQTNGSINIEPYGSSPPSLSVSFSRNPPINNSSSAEALSQLCEGKPQTRKRKHVYKPTASLDVPKSKHQNCQDLRNMRIKQEPGTLGLFLEKTRFDANQESISQKQHKITQELLLKELLTRNIQLNILANQLKQPVSDSVPDLRGHQPQLYESQMRNRMQDHAIKQLSFQTLLDGSICSRRVTQYLYHLRHRPHDNNIAYWKKFVSEYYAPGSRKRWCFSMYNNIKLHTGVFCTKSMDKMCCEICGSRPVKSIETTFEAFPRLFKLKYESGMVDEILFLDQPMAWKLPSGVLVLEYRKAVQESVYETFHVVHEGKLRIAFGINLKILSWEFCAKKHEEFLLRRVLAPQINELLQGAQKFIRDNSQPIKISLEDFQRNIDRMTYAAQKIVKDVEVQLVNDLGYPKRFVRCLQISEIVNSMKDLMAISHVRKMGPIECLNNFSNSSKINNHMEFSGSTNYNVGTGSTPAHFSNQMLGHNSVLASASKQGPNSQFSEHGKNPHQALIDKLLREMMVASKGMNEHDTSGKLNKEFTHNSCQNTFRSLLDGSNGNGTNLGTGGDQNMANASRVGDFPKSTYPGNSSAATCNITVKTEQCSPEQVPEGFQSSAGFSEMQDFLF